MMRNGRTSGPALATAGLLLAAAPLGAAEQAAMPLGALVCKEIAPAIEHAAIVRQPSSKGLREFVDAKTASGACQVIKSEVTVTVVDVDPRGFALIEGTPEPGRWWTDAENIWGYFDAPAKLKSWKR